MESKQEDSLEARCDLEKISIIDKRIIRQPSTETYDLLSRSDFWHSHVTESGSIVVATPFKAGTTLTQWLLYLILRKNPERANLSEDSQWVDASFYDKEKVLMGVNLQSGRKILKSHLPSTDMPIYSDVTYIVTCRQGLNVAGSLQDYTRGFDPRTVAAINHSYDIAKGIAGKNTTLDIPQDPKEFFEAWIDDKINCGNSLNLVRSWWELRNLPNVVLLHYNDIADVKKKLDTIGYIAERIGINPNGLDIDDIMMRSSIEYMKSQAERLIPRGAEGGAILSQPSSFFRQGVKRNFGELLTGEQVQRYEARALEILGPECAYWLETGDYR